MTYQTPTDKHVQQAAGRGHERSKFAQARWCNKPATLKPAPWDKPEEKEGEE